MPTMPACGFAEGTRALRPFQELSFVAQCYGSEDCSEERYRGGFWNRRRGNFGDCECCWAPRGKGGCIRPHMVEVLEIENEILRTEWPTPGYRNWIVGSIEGFTGAKTPTSPNVSPAK